MEQTYSNMINLGLPIEIAYSLVDKKAFATSLIIIR